MKKTILVLLFAFIFLNVWAADFSDKNLEVAFDIAEGTDAREFGFSQVAVNDADDYVSLFPEGKAHFYDNDNNDYTIIGTCETIYLYWKVLSSEDFELELSGEPLTTENAGVTDSELKTIHYSVSWKPVGYDDSTGDSVLNSSSSYVADEVYKHSPGTTHRMDNYDCIELVLTTDDAQAKVPGSYSATLTLGIKGV